MARRWTPERAVFTVMWASLFPAAWRAFLFHRRGR
jgi:hypothetical protein